MQLVPRVSGGWVRILSSLLLLLAAAAPAQRVPGGRYEAFVPGRPSCTLQIHVTGFRNNRGKAGGVVFASPAEWPEDRSKAVVHGGFTIINRQATETVQIPPGRYAIVVIHDENENQKLDRNFLGIPNEGFGFANNPKVNFSAPSWQAASTAVGCPLTQVEIRILYK
ncbi:MAG TPA: DUF2141 domain-containing protein [Acidobacteriaceae bacterium]|jgi:uncharacterized protein (DUF2141 family)|nr:DUF2141 domain-containing protein [Acidobacteriaceae bacterium]